MVLTQFSNKLGEKSKYSLSMELERKTYHKDGKQYGITELGKISQGSKKGRKNVTAQRTYEGTYWQPVTAP
jgi:hypothetical protein